MKKIILILIVGLCLMGCSNNNDLYKTIDSEMVMELANNGDVVIIDVRTEAEYSTYHIDDAINVPLDTITEEVISNLVNSKDDNIVVYCRSGSRSKSAALILGDLGYTNVYDLGSIDNWSGSNE